MIDPELLLPGDCLLYGRTPFRRSAVAWFFGTAINIKTWSRYCHVEVYDGEGESFASRDGQGVACYPLRISELVCVRRPRLMDYDHDLTRAWFDKYADGQKYDWLGLLSFTYAIHRGDPGKMFCSEFATRAYRQGGLKPFNPALDADCVAPAQLWQ